MNTLFLLMAQYQKPVIPLADCIDMFGIDTVKKANEYAASNKLPIATFQLAKSQRAPRMVKVQDLADWIDSQASLAKAEWEKSRSV